MCVTARAPVEDSCFVTFLSNLSNHALNTEYRLLVSRVSICALFYFILFVGYL